LPTATGKIFNTITQFRPFWAILPVAVGKKFIDSNGFKKTRHENG
jgi:hypothetical protein